MRNNGKYTSIEVRKETRHALKLFVAKKNFKSYDKAIEYMLGRLSSKNKVLSDINE